MTTLQRFRPKLTPDAIDTPCAYDYGPSIVDGWAWWCSGLGTDTIVGATWGGRRTEPYSLPGKLVADPCAIRTGTGFLVAHTIGEPDGTRNGIGWFTTDQAGAPQMRGVLVPQTTDPATYGSGQPALVPLPGDRYLLVHRRDHPGAYGASALAAAIVDSRTLRVVEPVHIGTADGAVEDGASPEAFAWGGWLYVALVAADQTGDGWVGLRRYRLVDTTLLRDVDCETAYPVTGGVFRALPGAIRIANAVDGCAIVRNATNDPVVTAGAVTVWRGWRASLQRTDTWRIVREPAGLPLGTAVT